MRLVVATPLYPPDAGGPATYAALLERILPEEGVEVVTVKFSEVRGWPKLIRHYLYYRKVRQALVAADAVLALDPVSTGLPALQAAQSLKKPFYVKIVGDYAWEQGRQRFGVTASLDEFVGTRAGSPFVRMLQDMERDVACAAARVIVPSEYLKRIVVTWGVKEEKVTVIHNAVSVEDVGTVPQTVAELPSPLVVTVGRLVPWKGVKGLIDAVKDARLEMPVSLVVVGEGPERTSLEAHAREALGDGYVFTGALSREDTLAVMRRADLFALNTAYEGFSHVLLEAALLGVPILTTSSGGNRELLTEESAFFAPVDQMSGELAAALKDPGRRGAVAASAQARAQRDFGSATLRRKLIDVLRSV